MSEDGQKCGKAPASAEGPARGQAGWKIGQLDFPTFRLGLLAKIMDRATMRELAQETDLSYPQWRVLARLGLMEAGGTVGDIARLAWVDRAEVSRAAVALEVLGLVVRAENPADGRAPILRLTEEGRATYVRVLRQRAAFHENLLADLTMDDRARLDDMLARIRQRLLGEMDEY